MPIASAEPRPPPRGHGGPRRQQPPPRPEAEPRAAPSPIAGSPQPGPGPQRAVTRHRTARGNFVRGEQKRRELPTAERARARDQPWERERGNGLRGTPAASSIPRGRRSAGLRPGGARAQLKSGRRSGGRPRAPDRASPAARGRLFKPVLITSRFFSTLPLCPRKRQRKQIINSLPPGTLQHFCRLLKRRACPSVLSKSRPNTQEK